MQKKTLVVGASANPERYAYLASEKLLKYGHEVIAIGLKEGNIGEIKIQTGMPDIKNIHTVTLYVGAKNQIPYYNYILALNPKRVLFNPGTENSEFQHQLELKGIEVIEGCTLVMLGAGTY